MQNGESAFFETYKRRTRVIRKTVGTTGVINAFSQRQIFKRGQLHYAEKKDGNNKKRKHRETGIAISPFLVDDWHPGISKEKAVLHEPQTEQENINREHTNYEEEK